MGLNVSKCALLSVTTKWKPSTYDYYMDDQQIAWTDNQDYLGITINTKTDIQKVEQVNRSSARLSQVTTREFQVRLPCALTSGGIHHTPDVASEMPLCVLKPATHIPTFSCQQFVFDKYCNYPSTESRPTDFSDADVRKKCCQLLVENIHKTITTTAPTAEAFQKAALEVIKSP